MVEEIQKTKERRNQTSISLNEENRLKEREEDTEPVTQDNSTVVNEGATISTETGTSDGTVKIDDVYLKEGLRLLAVIIDSNIG